ncbi:LOW QUALITY PROTEIN: PAX-interacting protein 1-like, partial [Drosophila serrata]|uniref:LOW QUALITY PROTEIN: PAX-interacting protein 1-like n=1 Tax=Drosophila serrata TaxID=7274 RepID=UPI000A1D37BE
MQLKCLLLALTLFNFLWLFGANADVHQNNGQQKVLPGKRLSDDLGTERDKSSAKMRKIFPQAVDEKNGELRLRHEQHHLRQQQHLMAWEQQLQLQLQQHLREQQQEESPEPEPEPEPVSVPMVVRHHQHKSLANPKPGTAKKPIRQAPSLADDKAKILVKRRLHYNEYDNDDLELHTMDSAEEGTPLPREWRRIEIAHRRQKEQHQLQLLAERQQQRQLLTTTTTTRTTTTTEPNNAQSEDNDVSASKGTRFNGLKPKQA